MPAPHVIECPVCFATLKLKAPPKRGARLKCPKCAGVFSPDGDEAAPAVEDDEPAEDDLPITRSRSRGKAGGKKKKKPVNLVLPISIAAVALLLVGGGVGLYLAKDKLFGGPPMVDLAYCQVPNRSMTLEFRVQEFLQSPAVTDAIRNGPQFGGSSAAMRELIGAEIGDVEIMQAQMSSPPGGFNPMMGAAQPADALAMLKCKRTLTPPSTGAFDHQGVKCYRVNESGNGGIGLKTDTMFFPNPTTVVIGKESTVRQILDNWKAGGAKPSAAPVSAAATASFFVDQSLITTAAAELSKPNPMMAMMMGPAAAVGDDLKQVGQVLAQQGAGLSFSAQLSSGQMAWTVSIHGRDPSGVQQIQTAIDTLRGKLKPMIDLAMGAGIPIPEANKKNLEIAQQVLTAPLQPSGDRVSLSIPVPADQQANSITMLAMLMPPMNKLKVGSASTSTTPTMPTTTPVMPTATPMMQHDAPAMPPASSPPTTP